MRRIPRGKVATYGDVARAAGLAGHARQVGYALHALPDDTRVPWHRVVGASGRVSPRSTPGADALQVALLRKERVRFDEKGRIDLARHRSAELERLRLRETLDPGRAVRPSGRPGGRR